jgi:adenosylmethionine-8-amino-7-oxononanoate aminotransferase
MKKIDEAIWRPFTQHLTVHPALKVKRGKGVMLELEDGRELIDAISSWMVNLHGHSHPKIAEAIYQQALKLEHVIFAGFSHDPAEELVEKLKPLLPKHLKKYFFSDNGSTSVEVALKMAYQYFWNKGEERKLFVALEGGYHGDTLGATAVSQHFSKPFSNLLFKVLRAPFPETFWGDQEVEKNEAEAIDAFRNIFAERGEEIAAVIIEPLMQGVSGMKQCRPQFLEAIEKIAHQYGSLVIFDEVLTGFGRTGTFLALEQTKCRPDFVCLSKGITGGFLPLALTVTTDAVFDSFLSKEVFKAFLHGHSYTANPLGCAAALASIELLEHKPYEAVGKKMKEEASTLLDHPLVEKARGLGTIFAFDLKSDENVYGSTVGQRFTELVEKEGVLIRPFGNKVYLMPPYCISNKEIHRLFQALQHGLASLLNQVG